MDHTGQLTLMIIGPFDPRREISLDIAETMRYPPGHPACVTAEPIMKSMWFVTLLLAGFSWGQDIVLKATFNGPEEPLGPMIHTLDSVDLNNDGINEIPVYPITGYGLLDVTTYNIYRPYPEVIGNIASYPQSHASGTAYISKLRSSTLHEWVRASLDVTAIYEIVDVISGDVLIQVQTCCYYQDGWPEVIVTDYDLDGLDDVIFRTGVTERQVYGIANGNPPISPRRCWTSRQ